jgi:hypothetical protein
VETGEKKIITNKMKMGEEMEKMKNRLGSK